MCALMVKKVGFVHRLRKENNSRVGSTRMSRGIDHSDTGPIPRLTVERMYTILSARYCPQFSVRSLAIYSPKCAVGHTRVCPESARPARSRSGFSEKTPRQRAHRARCEGTLPQRSPARVGQSFRSKIRRGEDRPPAKTGGLTGNSSDRQVTIHRNKKDQRPGQPPHFCFSAGPCAARDLYPESPPRKVEERG